MSINEQEKSTNDNNNPNENEQLLLDDITNYTMDKKLGEGRFSKVYLATHKLTSEKVAIKIIIKRDNISKGASSHIRSEIDILKRLKHNNICKLFSVIEIDARIYFIQEFIEGEDLSHFINQNEKLQLKIQKVCYYFRQIVSAIGYMDTMGIAHRDLKPENILITEKNEIKLVDFGLGSIYKVNNNIKLLKTRCGSPFYCAPEMVLGNKYYGNISDIWSLGVILYYMLFNELPFYEVDIDKLYKKIIEGKYNIPKDKGNIVGKDAIDLINKMLQKDPKKRIKVKDIIKHKWFNNEKNVLNIGLNIDEIITPIDEGLVDEINNKFGYRKDRIIRSILKNEYDKIYCVYLILLEKKIKNGEKSVADLKSNLYLDYINDEKNQIKNYDNNIENVIAQKLKYYEDLKEPISKGDNKNKYISNKKESASDNKQTKEIIMASSLEIEEDKNESNNISEPIKNKIFLSTDLSTTKNDKNQSYKNPIRTKNIYNENKLKKLKIIIEEKMKLNNEHHINNNKKKHKQKKISKKFNTNNILNQEENKNENQLNKINTVLKSECNNKLTNKNDSHKKVDISYKKDDKFKNNLKIDTKLELSSSNKRNGLTKKTKEYKKQLSSKPNHKSIDISENNHKIKERILTSIENNFKKLDNSNNNKTINEEISRNKKKKIKELLIKKSNNNNNNNQSMKKELLKKNEKNQNKGNKIKHSHLTYLTTSSNFQKENKNKKKNIRFYSTQTNFYQPNHNESKNLNNKKIETMKKTNLQNIKEINTSKDIKNKFNFTTLASPVKNQKNKTKIKERINTVNNKLILKETSNNDINNNFEHPFDLNYVYIFKDDENAKLHVEKKLKKKKIKFYISSKNNSEKNINYTCSKQNGLKFNIDIIKNKNENNFGKSNVYIYKIKNSNKSSNYDFYNLFKL